MACGAGGGGGWGEGREDAAVQRDGMEAGIEAEVVAGGEALGLRDAARS